MSKNNPDQTESIESVVELKAEITSSNLISYNNTNMGEILTLIDASLPNGEQKNALKSLIKQTLWRNYNHVWKWMSEQSQGNGSTFPFWKMQSVE